MPKAEVGSNKYLANKMKVGLQTEETRKDFRDFVGIAKHVRNSAETRTVSSVTSSQRVTFGQMQLVGEDPKKYIQGFSNDFQRDFLTLLRVAHGEKFVGANRFYNEYIRDKEHVHMNSTKWNSLTEFVAYLGREGIVTVKEDEKDGLMIAWRDTSIEAVRRKEEIRQQELSEAKYGSGEDKMLRRMEKRAKEEAEARAKAIEARKAAEAAKKPQESASPPADGKTPGADATVTSPGEGNTEETLKEDAAPVKISFGLKAKTLPTNKPGLGQMKGQSIFKRARPETGDAKTVKKVKL